MFNTGIAKYWAEGPQFFWYVIITHWHRYYIVAVKPCCSKAHSHEQLHLHRGPGTSSLRFNKNLRNFWQRPQVALRAAFGHPVNINHVHVPPFALLCFDLRTCTCTFTCSVTVFYSLKVVPIAHTSTIHKLFTITRCAVVEITLDKCSGWMQKRKHCKNHPGPQPVCLHPSQ